MILGAGSSVSQGMPSVGALDDLMKVWSSASVLRIPEFEDYFEGIWSCLSSYYAVGHPAFRRLPNFEVTLGEMTALAHWMRRAPYGDPLREVVGNGAAPTTFRFAFRYDPGGGAAAIAIQMQYAMLLQNLAQHIRQQCIAFDSNDAKFQQYQAIFDALCADFDVGVYNLNYDTLALWAMRGGHTGFDPSGKFDPDSVHRRSEWHFIYHLHGSVHCTLNGPFEYAMSWQDDLTMDFDDGGTGTATDRRSDDREFPRTTLIAGRFKLDQILVEPFQTFYAAMVRHVHEADAILICGYGFGDEHVNRALRSRLERTGCRPPVGVLTLSNDSDYPLEFRRDNWSHSVGLALNARDHICHGLPSEPFPTLSRLKSVGGFEILAPDRVAIWHNGFEAVSHRIDTLSKWLAGNVEDHVLAAPL